MIGSKVIHHLMMGENDSYYAGGLVNGARMVKQWEDVGAELITLADGYTGEFKSYMDIRFTAPVFAGDYMEYHGWIEEINSEEYICRFETWKIAKKEGNNPDPLASTIVVPPLLCGTATAVLSVKKQNQRGPQREDFLDAVHK